MHSHTLLGATLTKALISAPRCSSREKFRTRRREREGESGREIAREMGTQHVATNGERKRKAANWQSASSLKLQQRGNSGYANTSAR